MSTIHAPNLVTKYFPIPDANWVVFPANKHRTYFAIQDRENSDINIWIGEDPPSDTSQWFSIGGSSSIDMLFLNNGVQGPIYVAESGASAGEMTILSSLDETPETRPEA